MPNPRALVLFATTHGHTARIANRLADRLATRDLDVDLVSLNEASPLGGPLVLSLDDPVAQERF